MSENNTQFAFTKTNFILLGVGVLFIVVGLFLMSGGKSENPDFFNEEIFNFQRITLSVILIVTGFIIEVFAILHTPKED